MLFFHCTLTAPLQVKHVKRTRTQGKLIAQQSLAECQWICHRVHGLCSQLPHLMSLCHVQLLPTWVPSVFPTVDINALLFNLKKFYFQMWWNVLQQKQLPLFVTIKTTTGLSMPSGCLILASVFLKKEIKLNNFSSHTQGKKTVKTVWPLCWYLSHWWPAAE